MADTTNGQPAGKDPLAVLEELLAKQKAGGVAGADPAAEVAVAATGQPDPAQVQAERQAEYERIKAETDARDAALIAEQATKMEALKTTPQYQARIAQNEEAKEEKAHEVSEQAGYDITQIATTRVPVIEEPTS